MSAQPPQISILDARLAEIDDRLRTIQNGLAEEGPAPVAVPTGPAPVAVRTGTAAELSEPAGAHERLLRQLDELLERHERALAQLTGVARTSDRELGVSVGPLVSTQALREFERALARLPGVRGLELRGYEGGDRAVFDVRLGPTS